MEKESIVYSRPLGEVVAELYVTPLRFGMIQEMMK